MIYMGPEPWYLRVLEIPGELWSEIRIEMAVHHLPIALAWGILAALFAAALAAAAVTVMKR